MKIVALAVVLLLMGCAQTASRVAVPSYETTMEPQRAEAAKAAPAASTPLPIVPPLPAASATIDPAPLLAVDIELGTAGAQPHSVEGGNPPASVWKRLIAGFRMPPLENDLVQQWEEWYAQRPEYVARMIDRSARFLFFVAEQVEKRNMPAELALLPMIESAYNPAAYSRAHASGMWQFIPSTGRHYGLRQSWWYDERRDVIEATEAALDYLEKLYRMFGDWQLALAAYNCGEGAVSRAMERNQAKGLLADYESLTLPDETRNYVPKLIAVKNIISDPERYGLEIQDIANEPYFELVTVGRHIDVKLAAELAEIPLDEFMLLNPGHRKPVIRAGDAEQIVLPKDAAKTFRANLKRHNEPLVSWKAIRVRRGDKVQRVAAAHGMTLAELKRVNGLVTHGRVVPGQPLLVRVRPGDRSVVLPDIALRPVSLPQAIRVAKAKASARKGAREAPRAARRASAKRHGRSARARAHLAQRTPRAKRGARVARVLGKRTRIRAR